MSTLSSHRLNPFASTIGVLCANSGHSFPEYRTVNVIRWWC
jgi:hypothetical protein